MTLFKPFRQSPDAADFDRNFFNQQHTEIMTTQTQAVSTAVKKPTDIRTYIQSDAVKKQIAMVLPKHLTADVMARVVCTAILKTPRLAECRIESLLQAIMLLSQFGMLPDGRNAHLVPYFNTKANCFDCQPIIDWKGKVARASENGLKNIAVDVVCFNDKFSRKRTSNGLEFEHEIYFRSPDRGEVFAAYVTWKKGDEFDGEVMSMLEINNIRKRSKSPDKGPWQTDWNEMAKKTVVHRASKRWPLDAAFKEAIEVQEVNEATIELAPLAVVADDGKPPKSIAAGDDSNPELNPAHDSHIMTGPAPSLSPGTAESYKQILAANVSLEMFIAEIKTRNIALDADSWQNFETVPAGVWESLMNQPKVLQSIIKKWGVKAA
jgi:recombination protein RecT